MSDQPATLTCIACDGLGHLDMGGWALPCSSCAKTGRVSDAIWITQAERYPLPTWGPNATREALGWATSWITHPRRPRTPTEQRAVSRAMGRLFARVAGALDAGLDGERSSGGCAPRFSDLAPGIDPSDAR